jgi:hypothetical protein
LNDPALSPSPRLAIIFDNCYEVYQIATAEINCLLMSTVRLRMGHDADA